MSRSVGPVISIASLAFLAGCGSGVRSVGLGAALSTPFVDAVRLAFDDAGALPGMPPLDTVLLYEWSNRAAPALEMVDTFLQRPRLVGVVGHSNSSSSLATAPVYNDAAIVQIAPTSTAAEYSNAGPYSFRMVPPDSAQGRFLAEALDSLHPAGARVALMYVNDDYGRGLRSALLTRLDTIRFPLVIQMSHSDDELVSPPPDREERVQNTIGAVMASDPDLMLWLGRPSTFEMYLGVLRDSAGPIPVIGGDALGNWFALDRGDGDWDGVRYVDFLDPSGNEAAIDFGRVYRERYGREAGASEMLSYDAMRLLLAAVQDGATTGEEVRQWLMSLGRDRPPYEGISGPIAFDEHGDITRSYVLITVDAPVR